MVFQCRGLLVALIFLAVSCTSSAFYMHKFMAAALLANSFQRNPILPLPIPIPIPVKAGGNTIIALGPGDDNYETAYYPYKPSGCSYPPCSYGHGRRDDFW